MEARSAKVEPMTVPDPAMVSRSGVTVAVAVRARLVVKVVSGAGMRGGGGGGGGRRDGLESGGYTGDSGGAGLVVCCAGTGRGVLCVLVVVGLEMEGKGFIKGLFQDRGGALTGNYTA